MTQNASTSTINGFGTRLLGYSKRDDRGEFTATKWFVLLYCPVFPLLRGRFLYLEPPDALHPGHSFRFQVLEITPLQPREIVATYLFSYLGIPAGFVLPITLISLPGLFTQIDALNLVAGIFALAWTFFGIGALLYWDYRRPIRQTPVPTPWPRVWEEMRAQAKTALVACALGGVSAGMLFGLLRFAVDLVEGASIFAAVQGAAEPFVFVCGLAILLCPALLLHHGIRIAHGKRGVFPTPPPVPRGAASSKPRDSSPFEPPAG